MSAHAAAPERPHLQLTHASPRDRGARVLALAGMLWPTLSIAAILCWITFHAGGGLNLESMTGVEVGLTIGSALVIAAVVLLVPARSKNYGIWSVGLLLAFTGLTALSVVWSVQPDDSWQDAGRLLAYSGVFGACVALVRVAPSRWPAVLGGVLLAAVVVCGYALLTKVFPGTLDANDTYARLQAPYGYWNAIGLTAAMGAIGALWLGARRTGHALLSSCAYPLMGLFLATLMLAYSRGALAALALGAALWFVIVPLRLRGATVLIVGAIGAAVLVVFDFSRHALSSDGVALPERISAGHQFGVLLAAVLILLLLLGLCISFFTARRAPRPATRRAGGVAIVTLLVLAVVAFAAHLAMSHRGLFGTISHTASVLTNPHAKVPPNSPSRLTAVGSVRAAYWNQALEIFKAHPLLGSGARGYETAQLRYRTQLLEAHNAHGYIVQTLADLGIAGLVITLALLAAWMAAAGRSTHPFKRRLSKGRLSKQDSPYTAERVGMLSMLCLVVVFGIHSFVDWTWFVPGNACVALLCAGWLAGRGTLEGGSEADEPTLIIRPGGMWPAGSVDRRLRGLRLPSVADLSPVRIAVAVCVLLFAGLAIWAQWQPQRSVNASDNALALLERDKEELTHPSAFRRGPQLTLAEMVHKPGGALDQANAAVSRDPLSAGALFTLAAIQESTDEGAQARATLQKAVRLQPSNPQTWLTLARYDLKSDPADAVREFEAAIYLNPQSIAPELIAQGDSEAITIQNEFVEALRMAPAAAAENQTAKSTVKVTTQNPRSQTTGSLGKLKVIKPSTRAQSPAVGGAGKSAKAPGLAGGSQGKR